MMTMTTSTTMITAIKSQTLETEFEKQPYRTNPNTVYVAHELILFLL